MTNDGKYYTDQNGNRWNMAEYTEDSAEKASASLTNCKSCTDCEGCENCTGCRSLTEGRNCTNVSFSRGCRNCHDVSFSQDCSYCSSSSHINRLERVSGVDGRSISSEEIQSCMMIAEKLLVTDDAAVLWKGDGVWININGAENKAENFDRDVISSGAYKDIYRIMKSLGGMSEENFEKAVKIMDEIHDKTTVIEAFELLYRKNSDLRRSLSEMEELYLDSQSRLKEYQKADELQKVIASNAEAVREFSARLDEMQSLLSEKKDGEKKEKQTAKPKSKTKKAELEDSEDNVEEEYEPGDMSDIKF